METRTAIIGIIVEDGGDVTALNAILHEYADYIIGRMGIPHREKQLKVISIVLDAPMNEINTISGRIGNLSGISTKTVYAKK